MDTITCKKVTSLMSLYMDDRLEKKQKEFVEEHLQQCPHCQQKYQQMKNIIKNLKLSYEKILKEVEKVETANLFNIREYEKFHNNISAYIDNELNYEEGLEFRKYLLKSKTARNELSTAYNLQTLIKNSISEIKYPKGFDFSKKITKQLKNENVVHIKPKMYQKVAIVAGICVLSSTGLYILSNIEKTPTQQIQPIQEEVTKPDEEEYLNFKNTTPELQYKPILYSLKY